MALKQELNKKAVTIAERLDYTITVSLPKDFEIEQPEAVQSLGDFAVKDYQWKKGFNLAGNEFIARYVLETYKVDKAIIPEISFRYRQKNARSWSSIKAEKQEVTVKSLLKDASGNEEIKDIKEPLDLVETKAKKRLWILLILTLFITAGLIFFRKKKTLIPVAPPRPAHEIALEQLEELEKKGLILKGKIKEYFIEVSAILRHYLENRFNLRAPQMSSEEFLTYVRDYDLLQGAQKNLLKEFLLCCDLVKFAKYAPPPDEIKAVFDSARRFIEQTKEVNEVAS